uniref:Type I restriction modification DNA specificity domain-containing protein n=1 Tax=Leptospirillum ferrodiazotrophum TaxID=412449 RepID=C6HX03_9BACT|nr:MAG: protein of unknown function [Leptospirillum ferrodiazotrophum]
MSPFDRTRYERLLEGLEATEILYSTLLLADSAFRIDSEFFRRAFLQAKEQLEHQREVRRLCEISPSIEHPIEVTRAYSDDGTCRVLLAQEVRNNTLMLGAGSYLDAPSTAFTKKNKLNFGDIVLTRTGANFGQCAPVLTDETLFACADLLIIRKGSLPAEYVSTVLNTAQSRLVLDRGAYGMAQPHIAPTYLKRIPIPVFGQLIDPVKNAVQWAMRARSEANVAIERVEQILLQTLGLDNWTPPEALSYVRSSREAFAAGRFDAEYFHPAKVQALADLHALSDVCVGDLFESVRKLWHPTEAEGLPVRNYDLTDALDPFLDPLKPTTAPGEIASTKKCIAAGNLVVSRLRSYLREIAVVLPSDDGITAVASTEFIILRSKKDALLTVEALLIYLRSRLPQIVFKWSQDGSNHPRFDEHELLNLPVPRALITGQATYQTAVRQMVKQRQRATRLLDAAKSAVEIAIEYSEASALAYLKEVIKSVLTSESTV